MDILLVVAGLGVGTVVGLTGMGGGALMTPILVLFFGVPPLAAVSSDLVASAFMKPFGGLVHIRRRTVNWGLVGWLCLGSVPSAFSGVLVMRAIGGGTGVQHAVQLALGGALLLAVAGLAGKAFVGTRRAASSTPVHPKPLPTVILGAVAGLVVGMTSVGSGSMIVVVLLLLYPAMRANDLVGTDLVQAVPLVAAAAIGHALFGDLHLDLAAMLLVGAIPGVLIGARLSSRAPAGVIRSALAMALLASGLKLLGVSNVALVTALGTAIGLVAVVAAVRARRAQPANRSTSSISAPAAKRSAVTVPPSLESSAFES
jgi:uncharacterized membrane protein YfcA